MANYNYDYKYGYSNPDEEYWRMPSFTEYNNLDGGPGGTDVRNERTQDYGIHLTDLLRRGAGAVKGVGTSALNYLLNPSGSGILGLLAMLAAVKDRTPAYGGGTTMGMPAKTPVLPTKTQGKAAAQGGLMQAYAQGGSVRPFPMQDGGFVMTKRAVDGAGGPRGIAQLLPHSRPIRGPGTGTSDSIPATIQGRNGVTPAKVSNGEAYVPPQAVRQMGGARQLYALMNNLQRRA